MYYSTGGNVARNIDTKGMVKMVMKHLPALPAIWPIVTKPQAVPSTKRVVD